MSGANSCRGASSSEELDSKKLRGAARDLKPRGSPFYGNLLHGQSFQHHLLHFGVVILKCSLYTAMQYSRTSYDSVFLPQYVLQYFRTSDFKNSLRL